MAKTLTAEPDTSQQDETRRQRKKQAKQEAKIMLKVEQAKKDVEKAQKKLTRAQSNLAENQTHLQELEERLQQIRTSGQLQAQASQTAADDAQGSQPETSTAQAITDDTQDSQLEAFQIQEVADEVYQEPLLISDSTPPEADTEAIEAFHTASITPVEGRDDIATDNETAQTQEAEQSAQQVMDAQTAATFEPVEGRSDIATDSTSMEEQPLTEAESDVSSYPSDDQSTPSSEAVMETDTTTPDTTEADGNSTLSPDEQEGLVDRGNEEPELSHNPNASSVEENTTGQDNSKQEETEVPQSDSAENMQA